MTDFTKGKVTVNGRKETAMLRLQATPGETEFTTALVAWVPDGNDRRIAEANAEHLALCWNTHPDLVAALEWTTAHLMTLFAQRNDGDGAMTKEEGDIYDRACAALVAAGGEVPA